MREWTLCVFRDSSGNGERRNSCALRWRSTRDVEQSWSVVVVGRVLRSLCVSFGVVGIRKTFIIRNSYTPRLDTRLTLLLLLCFFRFWRFFGVAARVPDVSLKPYTESRSVRPQSRICRHHGPCACNARQLVPEHPSSRAAEACLVSRRLAKVAQTTKGKNRRQEGEAERAEGRHASRTHRRREGDLLLCDTE